MSINDPDKDAPDAAASGPALAAASGPVPGEPPPEPELEAALPEVATEPEPEATDGSLRESEAPQPTAMQDSVTTTQHDVTARDDRSFQNNANLRGPESRLSPPFPKRTTCGRGHPKSNQEWIHRIGLNDQRKLTA